VNNIYPQIPTQGMNNMPGDVMMVGEPSLMGGEMDDEDERYISRIENTQYDPNAALSQYNSPTHQIPQGYQQNPNLQSLLHHKQQFIPNTSQLLNPNQMKREQISFPGSPQLPSMFSNNLPTSNGANTTSNVLSSTPINGEVSTTGKRISATNNNSPQNHNQNSSTPTNSSWNGTNSSSTTNPVIAEKKQEPHTPPVTPQQTIITAS